MLTDLGLQQVYNLSIGNYAVHNEVEIGKLDMVFFMAVVF